jgi:hypothetical protein
MKFGDWWGGSSVKAPILSLNSSTTQKKKKKTGICWVWWLTLIILAIWEAEIRRIMV